MLKVLIVDDEIRVCRLIQYLFDWSSLGLDVLGYVNDGLSALHMIKEKNPDIVITDIRMPELGGLELIKNARSIGSNARFIIISGYSDFSYAQTAIKYGVDDYLLKPIKKKELVGTLEKIIEEFRENQKNIDKEEYMREQLSQSGRRVKGKLLNDLLDHSLTCDYELRQINQTYYCKFTENPFQMIGIQIMLYNNINEKAIGFLNTKLQDTILEGLSSFDEIVFANRNGILYCLINGKDTAFLTLKKDLQRLRTTFLNFKDMFEDITPVIALSEIKSSLTASDDMMRQVQDTLLNKLFRSHESILDFTGRPVLNPIDNIISSGFRKEFLLAIETVNYDKLSTILKGLAETLKNTQPIDGRYVLDIYHEVISTFLYGAKNYGISFDSDKFAENLEEDFHIYNSIDKIFRNLLNRITDTISEWQTEKALEHSKPIRLAKQYIKANFSEPLSLEVIGEQVGLNPAYFSSVFKKETGVSFVDYLTEVRIQNVKELLVSTGRSVNDIAGISGFNDLKYFNKKFRKYTGLSPSEYRKLYS
ncbi:MAG TPA: response regulator [Clostridiales bacterium]|nr:response regulator [Clostridiales bacterium]